ncbi:MAG: HpcH/HpaI aldolase/citrate lyase family protein [Alphaproteobacteria bacterium]
MRSLLFVPAANAKILAKSSSLKPDCLIYDLEDSAIEDEKNAARERLDSHLVEMKDQNIQSLIRINSADSPHFDEDLKLVAKASSDNKVQGVVLPKVDNAAQIQALEQGLENLKANPGIHLWAMIETPLGVLNAEKIATSSTNLKGFILGLEDLRTSLNIDLNQDRSNVSFTMQKLVMVAKAFDMLAIDAVCKTYQDQNQLRHECETALGLGFDGKSLIHPSQIEPANEVFGISKDALDKAHAIIDAFEDAQNDGKSIATLDGSMVEQLHFEAAKRLVLKQRGFDS